MKNFRPKHLYLFLYPFFLLADEEIKESFINYIIIEYKDLKNRRGSIYATGFCIIQIAQMYISLIAERLAWRTIMFKNYIKTTFRNLKRFKVYSFIKVFGLAIGLTCTILIFLFVQDELAYDRFHENLDNIYRLTTIYHDPDGSIRWQGGAVQIPHGPTMKEYFPEIIRAIRIYTWEFTLKKDRDVQNQKVTLADKGFFETFSFPLISGNPEDVLSEYHSIVLSESSAKKFFGDKDPIGESLTLILGDFENDFMVTGVAKDHPPNSTITFEMLINFEAVKLYGREAWLSNWRALHVPCKTYIEVMDQHSANSILHKYPEFKKIYYGAYMEEKRNTTFKDADRNIDPISFGLQRMQDIHFDQGATGAPNRTSLFILGGIAIIILFIAGTNFVTLSIGNASNRLIEIGIRKVVGAERKQLVRQFWSESVFMTGLAIILGLGLAYLLFPAFNHLTLKSLEFGSLFSTTNILGLGLITLLVGIFVGSYPALVLSSFKPVEILKGKLKLSGKNVFTRLLVIVQFALSIFLIVSTIILGKQINFMINKDLGFNKENTVVIQSDADNPAVFEQYRNRLSNHSNVIAISGAIGSLSGDSFIQDIEYNGKEFESIFYNRVYYDYFKTLEINFVEGRDFSPAMPTDRDATIVNETLVKKLEIENPIGKQIKLGEDNLTIIGVVKDFHTWNKKIAIYPAVHCINPVNHNYRYIMTRISPHDVSGTLDVIRSTWKEIQPDKPMSYYFLDEDVEMQYEQEKRWNNIIGYSSVLAILIACLGVFGLASISVSRRTKEIGIRKVHGATVRHIVGLLSKESILWVLIANVLAWPIAWYAMNTWLNNFAYKIKISLLPFVIAAISMLFVVLATTCLQTVKAALANPIDSIRYE